MYACKKAQKLDNLIHPKVKVEQMILEKHPKAEALIFDMDGTLTNSLPLHIETWQQVCRKFNFNFDVNMVEELTGQPTLAFAKRVLKDNNSNEAIEQELVRLKQEAFWDNCHLIEGHSKVIEFLEKYKGKIPMAVGTGANKRSAELQLKQLGIYSYFDAIVTANDVEKHKPNPETFLKCAELMGVEPNKCQVLEDGELGMQAAQEAGMYLIDVRPYTL